MATPTQSLAHNWRLKLSALGLSVFLWALVQGEPSNQEIFASVPVTVEVADTGWTTSGAPNPSTVELRLGGPAREIIRLAREGTSIRIPVGSVGSQDTVIVLRREWVELGQRSGLSVESMSPSTIRVSFEEAQTRLVPVALRLVGSVRDRLALAAPIEVSPQIIRVRGPRSRVEVLDSLRLEAFDLSDVARSGAFNVNVDTTGLPGASVAWTTATMDVRVEDMVERILNGISVEAIVSPGEAEVIPDPAAIQIRLAGARTLVTSLDPARLRVWVPPEHLQGMVPGEVRVVNVRIEGVPALVTAIPGNDRITVRRTIDQAGLPGDPP